MNTTARYRIESIDLFHLGTGATVLLIHLFALLDVLFTGNDWKIMILDWRAIMLSESVSADNKLASYGYPLWVVYLIWISIVLLLYPLSRKYMIY